MEKFANTAKLLIILSASMIIVCCLTYNYNTSAVSHDDSTKIFKVEENETFLTIADELKKENLIRSEFFYKLYVKINQSSNLKAGTYELSENLSVKELIEKLSVASTYNPDAIKITFPEGKQIKQIAEIIAENTNNTEEDILTLATNKEYIQTLINQYFYSTD